MYIAGTVDTSSLFPDPYLACSIAASPAQLFSEYPGGHGSGEVAEAPLPLNPLAGGVGRPPPANLDGTASGTGGQPPE